MRLLVSVLCAGCLPSRTVDLPLEAGEIAVAVVVEPGRPSLPFLLTAGSSLPLSLGEETQLFLWPLRAGDFVRADGSPLLQAELTTLAVRPPGSEPSSLSGSCGRCLAPWSTPPQPIFAGDSCTIPTFAADRAMVLQKDGRDVVTRIDLD